MSSPLMLVDPKKPLFRWGPVPGRLFFMSEFNVTCYVTCYEKFGYGWCNSALLFFHDRLLFTNEAQAIEETGKKVFLEQVFPRENRQLLYRSYEAAVVRLRAFQDSVTASRLAGMSQEEFLESWKQFYAFLADFWLPTIAPEFGNYGSGVLLEEALKEQVPAEEIAHVMEVLTAPEELSFYQEEEIELSETEDIKAHAEKYHWLKNSYGYCEHLPVSFFEKREKDLDAHLREKMEQHVKEAKAKKTEVLARYALSERAIAIAEGLHDALVWQDKRKREIVESIAYKNMFLEEAARRLGIPATDLYFATCDEVPLLFSSRDFSVLSRRKEGCLLEMGTFQSKQVIHITDYPEGEMRKLWDLYLEEQITDTESFKGITACKGKGPVRGKVKILLRPEESDTFEKGSVLVAPMTSPEYVFAMKQACAILTDTGGLTSHAAIVSRELGVPCLVGTKVATRLLKDGDEVEVDAEKGIVRVLRHE